MRGSCTAMFGHLEALFEEGHPDRERARSLASRTHELSSFLVDVLEVDLEAWRAADPEPRGYTPLPKYPAVFRDFAVVVPAAVRAGDVAEAIRASSPEGLVADVAFQSVYTGEGVAEGMKSLAWAVTFRRADGTLDHDTVQALEQAVWASLRDRVQGAPRA